MEKNARRIFTFSAALVLAGAMLASTAQAETATLYFTPSAATKTVGDDFTVTLKVNSGGVSINAAEATITFPADKLEVTGVAKGGSTFTLWPVDPSYSNKTGTISFSGGRPSPGYKGTGGTVIVISFSAKGAGSAKLTVSGAQVLANDGQGTDILGAVGSATFTIKAKAAAPPEEKEPGTTPPPAGTVTPVITSTTNPDQSAWYPARDVSAVWTGGSGVLGYNAVFDQTGSTVPPETSEGLANSFKRTALPSGTYYLHVRGQYKGGWSDTRHYRFQIDGTAPTQLAIKAEQTAGPNNRTVTFSAIDSPSGISRYEIKLDNGSFQNATSPYALADVSGGHHTLTLRAIDRAENAAEFQTAFDVATLEAPTVFLDLPLQKMIGEKENLPTVATGAPLTLRGFAQQADTIHVLVRSSASVFDFPVAEIIDPQPVTPAPEGLAAWKVELHPDLSPGFHEISVTRTAENGQTSVAAPTIRFRVVGSTVRLGNTLVAMSLVVKVQFGVIILLLGLVLAIIVWHIFQRRRYRLWEKWPKDSGTRQVSPARKVSSPKKSRSVKLR